jgi:hypothetical protein
MTNSPEDFEPVIRENTIEARPWHLATEAKVDQAANSLKNQKNNVPNVDVL